MNIGFALTGSFCTYDAVFPVMERLAKEHEVYPILSFSAAGTDSRFGAASDHRRRVTQICARAPMDSIPGEGVLHAKGLPGKYKPEASGKLIAKTILHHLTEV